jgi:phage tail protein X
VLCYPDSRIVIDLLRTLVSTALKPGAADYREALYLASEALAAGAGDAPSKAKLDNRREEAHAAAGSLLAGRRTGGDAWGHHCRRLAALGESYALGVGDPKESAKCLDDAQKLPFGYAGFQALASLTLAEANRVCRPDAAEAIAEALKAALRSAHNIQEPPFCAASTARINAMRDRWWRDGGRLADLPAIVERFVRDPAAAEFAPTHIICEGYARRAAHDQMLDVSPEIRGAVTLDQIARHVCQRPVAEVVRLNPGIDPTTPLPPGTEVNLPDPAFAAILAARMAAEALAQREQLKSECARLIRKLVPVATPNCTALDTVLARLLLADPPLSSDLLAQARAIAPSDWMVEPVRLEGVEA